MSLLCHVATTLPCGVFNLTHLLDGVLITLLAFISTYFSSSRSSNNNRIINSLRFLEEIFLV